MKNYVTALMCTLFTFFLFSQSYAQGSKDIDVGQQEDLMEVEEKTAPICGGSWERWFWGNLYYDDLFRKNLELAANEGDFDSVKAMLIANPTIPLTRECPTYEYSDRSCGCCKPHMITTSYYCHPLQLAVEKGNTDVAEMLLKRKAYVWNDLLKIAIENQDAAMITLLDQEYRDIKPEDYLLAVEKSTRGILELLDELDPNLTCHGEALQKAAKTGDIEVVNYLTPKSLPWEKEKALLVASSEGKVDIVKYLIEDKTPVKVSHLVAAAQKAQIDAARILLAYPMNLEEKSTDTKGITPLHAAIAGGSVEMVRLLLEKGANVETVTSNGLSPLTAAIQTGSCEIVQLLLENKAKPKTTYNGKTLLYLATLANGDIVSALLDAGVDINALSASDGNQKPLSPLLITALNGKADMFRLLLARGADTSVLDGYTFSKPIRNIYLEHQNRK